MAGKGSYHSTEKEGKVNVVDWLTHDRVGTTGDYYRKTQDVPTAFRMDDTTTANTIYLGVADVGAAGSEAIWRIKKLDTTSGLTVTWADGNSLFDNIWDNRASLSYS